MLGISTCRWHGTPLRGHEILSDALKLGFHGVELEYRIANQTYQEIKQGVIKIMEIHSKVERQALIEGREMIVDRD